MGHLNRGVLAARRSRRAVACAARMPAAADASGARGTARSATDCPHPALTGAARLRRSRGAVAPTRAARMPEAADASGARGTARSATDCPHPELTGAARLHTCRPFSGCRRAHPCGTHARSRGRLRGAGNCAIGHGLPAPGTHGCCPPSHPPPRVERRRGDGRGRHPPQERPRPSRGTGRARPVSSTAPRMRFLSHVPCHELVASCTVMDGDRFQVVTCLSRQAAGGKRPQPPRAALRPQRPT